MASKGFQRDPVDIAASFIMGAAQAASLALFLAMVAVWSVIGSGRLPL